MAQALVYEWVDEAGARWVSLEDQMPWRLNGCCVGVVKMLNAIAFVYIFEYELKMINFIQFNLNNLSKLPIISILQKSLNYT